jgi:hypothetical protein
MISIYVTPIQPGDDRHARAEDRWMHNVQTVVFLLIIRHMSLKCSVYCILI